MVTRPLVTVPGTVLALNHVNESEKTKTSTSEEAEWRKRNPVHFVITASCYSSDRT